MNKDSIEKKILLQAPRKRIWRALSDSKQFGSWFGVQFEGSFAPGATMRGVVVTITVNAEVADSQKPYQGLPFEMTIEQMEPERMLSFRWHPYAVDRAADYSSEPTTLVVFQLEEMSGGVMLTVTESGFDQIPLARRAQAFTANEQGWGMMVKVLEEYIALAA